LRLAAVPDHQRGEKVVTGDTKSPHWVELPRPASGKMFGEGKVEEL
jgi:hypothetical protein